MAFRHGCGAPLLGNPFVPQATERNKPVFFGTAKIRNAVFVIDKAQAASIQVVVPGRPKGAQRPYLACVWLPFIIRHDGKGVKRIFQGARPWLSTFKPIVRRLEIQRSRLKSPAFTISVSKSVLLGTCHPCGQSPWCISVSSKTFSA